MEFTLPQLSPENIKLIFEGAAYDVTEFSPHTLDKDGDIESYGGVTIVENGYQWLIQPCNDNDNIQFVYPFFIDDAKETPEEVFLKMSNIYDRMPVHMKYTGQYPDGDHGFQFINSAIFPEGEAVEGKRLIKIFRTFQRMVKSNMQYFDHVKQKATES